MCLMLCTLFIIVCIYFYLSARFFYISEAPSHEHNQQWIVQSKPAGSTMGNWSSLRGSTFPTVVSTCTNSFCLLIQWIASLPTIVPRALSSLYYTFLTLKFGQLTLGRQVLHKQHENNDEIEVSESELPDRPTNIIELLVQTEKLLLKPSTTGTLVYCSTAFNSHLHGTTWVQSAIYQSILTGKADSIPILQLPRNNGQTTAGPSSIQSAASLKRKASSASVGNPRSRRSNNINKGNGDDENNEGEDNPNPPNARPNNKEDPAAGPEKYFACHFFKLNPREYHRCGSKQLKTVDNVKQHLKRAHYIASLHCRCCWAEFGDNQEALRNHAIGECDQRQGPDTLYDEDLRLLITERGSPDRDKWYQIWRQICEGHQEPDSPYIDMNAIDEFGRLIGRDIQSRIMALVPSLCSRYRYQVEPELTTRIVNTLISETFSHPALFEYRYRRTFPPGSDLTNDTPFYQAPLEEESDQAEQALSPSYYLPDPASFDNLDHDGQ